MNDRPAEVFPVGTFLAEELAARARDAALLADPSKHALWLSRRCPCLALDRAQRILDGTATSLRFKEVEEISTALGVSAVLLVNLDTAYHQRKGGAP